MDKFVDKDGKVVLTIDDDGKEIKDEKFFEDKKKLLESMSDNELVKEFLKRELPGVLKDSEKLKKALKELRDDTTKS